MGSNYVYFKASQTRQTYVRATPIETILLVVLKFKVKRVHFQMRNDRNIQRKRGRRRTK